MKNHIISVLLTAIAMIGFISCSEESEPATGKFANGEALPGRIDLSGAVSLAMGRTQSNSRAIDGEYLSSSLYKIDQYGRISAVAVYFTTDKNGNRLEHEEKLRLCPDHLKKLTDNYVLAVHCSYYDKDGDEVRDKWIEMDGNEDDGYWIIQDVPYKNLLIRLSDGKIWCIDQIIDNIWDWYYLSVKGTFAEDNNGVLYHNVDGHYINVYRFNLTGITPSYEQIAIADKAKVYSWHITDNGVIWGPEAKFGCNMVLAWHQSGYQIFNEPDIRTDISNFSYIPDLTDRTAADILLEPSADTPHARIFSHKNNPILILPIHYSVTGILNKERPDYNLIREYVNATKKYASDNCPFVLFYEISVGSTPGSAIANAPIQFKGIPEDCLSAGGTSVGMKDFEFFQMGDRIVLASEHDNSTELWELDLVKKEWNWLKKLDTLLSSYEYSYKNRVYNSVYPYLTIKEGIDWYDPYANEGGFLRYENPVPDYMELHSIYDINDGFLRFSGRNPANGNEEEIVIDIETGKILNHSSQAVEWKFQTIISLN
ncbi:hypothetical protein [Duncaniella muris]|uniref:hypothetical protein n=1 Tax=Duncaniella muris TaxID=2094150 RepID=UPI001C3E0DAA|nr:hypothetical protein [Duncaniella muris]